MSALNPRRYRRPFRVVLGIAVVLSLVASLFLAVLAQANSPTDYVDVTNHAIRWSGTGTYDWANGPVGAGACTIDASGVITCPGGHGLFDGGTFINATTPPLPPSFQAGSDPSLTAHAFLVDPLASDSTAACGAGDPTVFTGKGGEVNGELFSTMTYGTGSVPPKDEIANVYAVAHGNLGQSVYEIAFGAERVVNNGDSHIDFEFLQSEVTTTGTCSGSFVGDRTQGDLLLSVDFTNGGTLGGNTLYEWHCAAEGDTQPPIGTVCNPPDHGKSVPHYEPIGSTAVSFGVNDGGAIDCGGWACRNSDGTLATSEATNEFMEGAIDLNELGFDSCIGTFLPHTRSSQSFTATLKDFGGPIPFNTCNPTTTMSVSPSASQLVHSGDSVTLTYSEANDGNVSLTGPSVSVSFDPTGPTGCATTTLVGGDTNGNGNLDPGETFSFQCTATFPSDGVYTVTGIGHGTFNGQDITYPTDPDERAQTEVRVISPATTLTKSASATTIHSGDSVTYTYTETNGTTGGNAVDRAISGVSVSDDTCSPVNLVSGDTNGNNKLDADETWTFTCSTTLSSTTTNTAVATGTDALGSSVTWCADPGSPPSNTICSQTERAQATVTVINPNTTLVKSVTAVVSATYTYKETNTGDVDLTNPSVADDTCASVSYVSGDANSDGKLNPGETWEFTCTVTSLLTVDTDGTTAIPATDSKQNTAVGHGTDPLGLDITYPGFPSERDQTTVSVTVSKP